MARATDAQVQQFVNERVRPRCEQMRALAIRVTDDIAAIGDVYAHVSGAGSTAPTWEDTRTDAPPTLLDPNDVLAWNTAITALKALVDGTDQSIRDAIANNLTLSQAAKDRCALLFSFADQYPIVLQACVRPPEA